MRVQFAGARSVPNSPTVSVIAGTTTSSRSGFLFVQTRGRGGFSQASAAIAYTLNASQGLSITLPADLAEDGEDVRSIYISIGATNLALESRIVAAYHRYETDEVTLRAWPGTVTLTSEAHFALEAVAIDVSSLPSDPISGMRRSVSSLGIIQEYDARTSAWGAAIPNEFSAYVASAIGVNGINREIRNIADSSIVLAPRYGADGSDGVPVAFWVVNDETAQVAEGINITFNFESNGSVVNDLVASISGMMITFKGYVSLSTGEIDGLNADNATTMVNLDIAQTFDRPDFAIPLPKNLPANTAVLVTVSPKFTSALTNGVLIQGQGLACFPAFSKAAGSYVPGANVLGDLIYRNADDPNDGLRYILPNTGLTAIAAPGTGYVDQFLFEGVGAQTVVGLSSNTANQLIAITGNATCFKVNSVSGNAALRAIISTLNGVGPASSYAPAVTLTAGQQLSIAVTYPTRVRTNYPDAIKGNTGGAFNGTNIRVYVRHNGVITYYLKSVTVGALTDTIVIDGSGGTVIAALPTVPSTFGLHRFLQADYTPSAVAGASTLAAGTYEIALAVEYNGTITEITHDPSLGIMPTLLFGLGTVIDRLAYWAEPAVSPAALRTRNAADVVEGQAIMLTKDDLSKVIVAWDANSLAVDDGEKVFKLDSFANTDEGRFLVVSGAGSSETGESLTVTGTVNLLTESARVIVITPGVDAVLVLYAAPTELMRHRLILSNAATLPVEIRDSDATTTIGTLSPTGSKFADLDGFAGTWNVIIGGN